MHEAHDSTAIEGNTLVLRQVEQLLLEGRAVGDEQLADYLEVKGYGDAARRVHGQGLDTGSASPPVLTVQQVRHIHVLATTPVWDVAPHPDATERETPGDFREHDIRAFPGGMTPPSHVLVAPRLRDWLDAAAAIGGSTDHVLDGVARLHVEFEQIHPLLDGNGRTGRLITNLVLARHGYPPGHRPGAGAGRVPQGPAPRRPRQLRRDG